MVKKQIKTMAKTTQSKPSNRKPTSRIRKLVEHEESDSTYFLKLVLYMILGSLWIKLVNPIHLGPLILNGLPIGLIIGILYVSHEHFQINRKIGYAIMLVMTVISFFLPVGIII
ncbi:hypothetical protein EOM57_01790 [Candidatus Saccharibacteria bacterium]|nr:hypothetical protein [Candidatus Saccharibacteria bacterium]